MEDEMYESGQTLYWTPVDNIPRSGTFVRMINDNAVLVDLNPPHVGRVVVAVYSLDPENG
jgi:hypothetical protein